MPHARKGLKLSSVLLTLVFFALSLVLSVHIAGAAEPTLISTEQAPPAPTLISIQEGRSFVETKPVLTGLTVNNTQVDIYLDNQYSGPATVRNHQSGTANFYYYPTKSLELGSHTVHVVAKKGTNISQETSKINFQIIPISKPTLFTPVFNLETIETQPFIIGLIHNNLKVKIYIDDIYDGEIIPKYHPSGVANFAYKPKNELSLGIHQVKAKAVNLTTNQESGFSGLSIFSIESPFPAPTLFQPTVKNATYYKPNINGLSKNGSHVDIYINNVKHRLDLADNPSGTASFTYKPEENLKAGVNVIFAVAYSKDNKMSRKSNPIYWDLTPTEQGVAEAETPDLIVKEPEKPPVKSPAEPAITEEAPGIEIETKDRSQEAEVTIQEESPEVSGEEKVSEEVAEPLTKEAPEAVGELAEEGPNWSKIIGLIILAVLIIVLIIQLLKKEEPGEPKGETLKLFEDGKDKDGKDKDKKSTEPTTIPPESPKSDFDDSDNNIPPPPPPSSNLPF